MLMAEKLTFESVNCGDVLPEVKQHMSQEVIWRHAVASLDYNPVHVHPEWCKTARVFGLPVPVMHGNQTMSLMIKVVTNWAYPVGGRLKRMEVKLIKPVPVGSTCTYGAVVTEKHPVGKGGNFVVLDLWAMDQDGDKVAVGTAEVMLP
jgi:3-hydroxybutyryl-CoA dehydratase